MAQNRPDAILSLDRQFSFVVDKNLSKSHFRTIFISNFFHRSFVVKESNKFTSITQVYIIQLLRSFLFHIIIFHDRISISNILTKTLIIPQKYQKKLPYSFRIIDNQQFPKHTSPHTLLTRPKSANMTRLRRIEPFSPSCSSYNCQKFTNVINHPV